LLEPAYFSVNKPDTLFKKRVVMETRTLLDNLEKLNFDATETKHHEY